MALLAFQPGATQANKTYLLATFAAHTGKLAASLQRELALTAGFANGSVETGEPSPLPEAIEQTRFDRHDVAKNWGRFNSSPYSPALRHLVETALGNLDSVERVRKREPQSERQIASATVSFARPTNDLLGIGTEFGLLSLDNEEMDRLRSLVSQTLRYAKLLNNELVAGSRFLAASTPGNATIEKLAATLSARRAFLSGGPGSAGVAGRLSAIADKDAVKIAAAKGENLNRLALTDARTAFPAISDWAQVYANAIETLVDASGQFLLELTAIAKSKARDADFIFILAVSAATVLTALLLAHGARLNRRSLFVLVMAAVNVPLISWRFASGSEFLADEGGIMEMGQVALLGLGFVLFSIDAVRSPSALRSAAVIMACACLFMFFREMDFRTLGAPQWVVALSSGPGRRMLFYIGLAILLAYAFINRRHLLEIVRSVWSLRAWPLYLWPALLLVGEAVEFQTHATRKDELHGYWSTGQFWEELLELDAYIVLVFAALAFSAILRNDPGKSANPAKQRPASPSPDNLSEQPVE